MRSLIIGAGGFVGKYLSNYLIKNGETVFCSMMKLEYEALENKARCYAMDLLDDQSVLETLSVVQPDVVYHLAAQSSVGLSWKEPQRTVSVNCIGFMNILEALRKLKINPRMIVVGSSEEYGPVPEEQNPIDENRTPNPMNPYSISKYCQYQFAQLYSTAYSMDIITTRSFNHIGPGQSDVFVVSDFCKRVAMIEKRILDPVLDVGNLEASRDFTDVRDVVRAYYLLAQKGKRGAVYNIGSGKAYQIQDLLNMILAYSTADIEVRQDPAKFRPIDLKLVQCNNAKLYADTGWQSEIEMDQSIKDVLAYWRAYV